MGARVSADDGPGVARRCVLSLLSPWWVLRRMILVTQMIFGPVRASFEFRIRETVFRSGAVFVKCEYKYVT